MPNQILTIRDSLFSALTIFLNFIPTLIGGILILAIGWILSSMLGRLVAKILAALKVDHATERTRLSQYMVGPRGPFTLSHGVGFLSKWFVRLIFLQAVANLFQMPQVTAIINDILMFIPNLAVALVILVAGLYFSDIVATIVKESAMRAGITRPGVLSLICRYGVVGFAIIAALNHIGIAAMTVNILYIGFVASLSLALGLSFGLGGQVVAEEVTRNWYNQNKPVRLTPVSRGNPQNASGTMSGDSNRSAASS